MEVYKSSAPEELNDKIHMLTKERDSLYVLWQTAQKTIDALETELHTYQRYEGKGHQNTIEEKRNIELKLESSLTDYLELEDKYKDLHNKHNSLQTEIINKDKEIAQNKETIKDLEGKLEESSKSIEQLRIELGVEKKSNTDLRSQVALCQKESVTIVRKEAEARIKVGEALQLYDLVAAQKEEAFRQISLMTEEISTLKQELTNVRSDTELRCRTDVDAIRDACNEKVNDMLTHLRNLDEELVEKGLLLNKVIRENKILQAANNSYLSQKETDIQSVEPKLKLAEEKLQAMFQELVCAERRCIKAECEKQCVMAEARRAREALERDAKRRDWEEQLLQNECKELRAHMEHLQKSLQESHDMISRLQGLLADKSKLDERTLSLKGQDFADVHKQLENQVELNKKWKESYVDMMNKLKHRLKELLKENKALKKQVNKSSATSSSKSTCDSTEIS